MASAWLLHRGSSDRLATLSGNKLQLQRDKLVELTPGRYFRQVSRVPASRRLLPAAAAAAGADVPAAAGC